MFENLITRITSPNSRRRYIYNCTPHHTILSTNNDSNASYGGDALSEPEDNDGQDFTKKLSRPSRNVMERRRIRGKKVVESGLRQARSLGRLDGLREAERLSDYSQALSGSQPVLVDPRSRDLDRIQQLFPQDFLGLHDYDANDNNLRCRQRNLQVRRTYSTPNKQDSTRCFLMEAPCALAPPNNPQSARPRHLFLFNDILVIGKARNATTYKLKEIVRISEIWIHPATNDLNDTGFLVGWPGGLDIPRTYLTTFTTNASKDLWYSALQNTLLSKLKTEPSFTNIQVSVEKDVIKSVTVSPELTVAGLMRLVLPRALLSSGYQMYCCQNGRNDSTQGVTATLLNGYERPHSIQLARLRQDVSTAEGFDLQHCLNSPPNSTTNSLIFQLKPINSPKVLPKKSPLKIFRKNNTRIWSTPLSRLCTNGTPPQIILAILRGLLLRGPHTHGIFRRCASIRSVRELRDKIDRGGTAICEELHLHTNALLLAALLKDFLRNLPEPLITGDIIQWVKNANKVDRLRNLVLNLPRENNSLLAHIICVLYHVAKRAETNQMTPKNLGLCVGPSLMWGDTTNPIKESATIVENLIVNCKQVFGTHVSALLGEPTPDSGAEESDSLHSLVDSVELSRDQKSLSRDSGLTLSEDDRDSPGLAYLSPYQYRYAAQRINLSDLEIHHAKPATSLNVNLNLSISPSPPGFQRGGWWRQPATRADICSTRPPIYRQPPPVLHKSTECILIDESESYV